MEECGVQNKATGEDSVCNCECYRYRITSQDSEEVPALQCLLEEVNGLLPLHAARATREGYRFIVICS